MRRRTRPIPRMRVRGRQARVVVVAHRSVSVSRNVCLLSVLPRAISAHIPLSFIRSLHEDAGVAVNQLSRQRAGV